MLLHESHRTFAGVIMFLIVQHACRHLSMYASQILVYEHSPYVFVCVCVCVYTRCVHPGEEHGRPGFLLQAWLH